MNLYPDMTPQNTALLVIDPVNSCANENCETPERKITFSKIREMLPRLDAFIKEYRAKVGGLVVLTTITPWDKEHLPENLNILYTDPRTTYYSENKSGFEEQFYLIKPEPADFILTKNTYDCFADGILEKEFKKRGITYVIVTGIFTDGCVLASVISGFSKGFNFVILKDLVETTDAPIRQQLQQHLIDYTFPIMYGHTIPSTGLISSSFTKKYA